ncbi:MAG: preprotein translocase subunit SecE [Spiroplasma sp.]|nr:preprotein translocase subunit SecE [Spiroplasma sp.]
MVAKKSKQSVTKKSKTEKPHINREKVKLLKDKFNFLRKVKPLKFRKSNSKEDKFDRRNIDNNKIIDMNAIWEKSKKERTAEEKFYYRKEARTYHKYFFLYLSREARRIRWTRRKELNKKFWTTVLFIAFFAGLFAILDTVLEILFRLAKIL